MKTINYYCMSKCSRNSLNTKNKDSQIGFIDAIIIIIIIIITLIILIIKKNNNNNNINNNYNNNSFISSLIKNFFKYFTAI